MTLEIQVLAGDRHKMWQELNRLMESQPSPFDNWIPNSTTYINKWENNPAQIDFYSKRPHTITKMKDNITMDMTKTGSHKECS